MAATGEFPKTTLRWRGGEHEELQTDLSRFKARAIGRRLKELAELGLIAERRGFSVERGSGVPRLSAQDAVLVSLAPQHEEEPTGTGNVFEDLDFDADMLGQFTMGGSSV